MIKLYLTPQSQELLQPSCCNRSTSSDDNHFFLLLCIFPFIEQMITRIDKTMEPLFYLSFQSRLKTVVMFFLVDPLRLKRFFLPRAIVQLCSHDV